MLHGRMAPVNNFVLSDPRNRVNNILILDIKLSGQPLTWQLVVVDEIVSVVPWVLWNPFL